MAIVLLTGATGFLGSLCLERLVRAGHEVHAVARRVPSLRGATGHALDLLDPKQVKALVEAIRPSHLLHLAWLTTPGVYWTSPENERWVEASLHLFREFRRRGGHRAVLAGTCAEYDWSDGICNERTTALRPTTLYGRSKLRLWEQLQGLGSAKPSTAWARLFYLYGPGEHPARLVASVIRALLSGKEAHCTAGTQRRDFIHAVDAADALVSLLESDVKGSVNIGTGQAYAVADIVRLIGELLEATERVRLGDLPMSSSEPPLVVADVSRLREEVGWTPTYDLKEGIAHTLDWWRAYCHAEVA